MKKNILVVGFLKELNHDICIRLSKELNMFYADVSDLVAYELSGADEMITKCGIDYYQKQEQKTMKKLAGYENTIININYDYFFSLENYKLFIDSCYMIYAKISAKKLNEIVLKRNDTETWPSAIDAIDYEDRDKFLSKNVDFVAYNDKLSSILYVSEIKKYLQSIM